MLLKVKSLFDYAFSKKAIIRLINNDCSFNYYKQAPERDLYESWQYNEVENRPCSRQYIALFTDVVVRGATDGLIVEDLLLTDKIDFDMNGFLEHLPYRVISDGKRCLVRNSGDISSIPRGISLVKMWSTNYFHFVIEGMSRLGEIDKLDEYKDWPLIIDSCVRDDIRNIELINLLNINNRNIIWINEGECIKVDKLIYPPTLSWATWDIKESVTHALGYMLDKKAGQYIRDTVLSQYNPQKLYNCVYVARGNNDRLKNESEIIDYLTKEGFSIFYPDRTKHYYEELDCFATANCIILCAGGAATNLVFCKKTTDVFCFLPFEFRCDNSQDITSMVGIVSHMIDCKIIQNGGMLMKSSFEVSLNKMKPIVDLCKRKGYL